MTGAPNAKILIVDDSELNRELLSDMLSGEFDITCAEDGDVAVEILKREGDAISLVLLDVMMPRLDGFDVLKKMKQMQLLESIPVIMISAEEKFELIDKAYTMGATDYILRSQSLTIIQKRVSNTIRLFAKQKNLLEMMRSENEALEEKNYRILNFDELTGCLNSIGFNSFVSEEIKSHPEREYSMVRFDFRNFRFYNDEAGYRNGDGLLKYFVKFLSERLGTGDGIARINNDIFSVFIATGDENTIKALFEMTLSAMRSYVSSAGHSFKVDMYAGAYVLTETDVSDFDYARISDCLALAHKIAKEDKNSRVVFYDKAIFDRQYRDMQISQMLPDAIKNGEIEMYLQPQINYSDLSLIGAEALARWPKSKMGRLFPDMFVHVLESTGQILDMDKCIWRQACEHIRKWRDEGKNPPPISINISRIDIMRGDVVAIVSSLVKEYSLTPNDIRIEITESAYTESTQEILKCSDRFRSEGFIIEMDDFGSGYSSLNMLRTVDFDILKLDMKFLSDTKGDVKAGSIISGVIRLADSLKVKVLAEGVETSEQADLLYSFGCEFMQGYYFSRPIPIEEYEAYMLSHKAGAVNDGEVKASSSDYIDDLMDAKSSLSSFFNHCLGPSLFLEKDNGTIRLIMENKAAKETPELSAFPHLLKQGSKFYPIITEMTERAKKDGVVSEDLTHDGDKLKVTLRSINRGGLTELYFCTVTV